MNEDPRYGEEVRRRMAGLPGGGDLPDGPGTVVVGEAGDAEQGARVRLELRVLDDRVADARFRAFGCPHFLASASWLVERLPGSRRADLEAWDWRAAATALDVPPSKFGRLLTIQDAARAAARNWPGSPRSEV